MTPFAPTPDHDKKQSAKAVPAPIKWVALILVLGAAVGIFMRLHDVSALRQKTRDDAIIRVTVVKATPGPQAEDIVLPGNVQAWHEAPVYARTSGYLKKWNTDIGAHVKENDVLALIESPEIDAQLRQAQADLTTAQANSQLAQTTARRWETLLKTNSVSKQEADEKVGDATSKAAAVAAAQANVERLQQLKSFELVTAPFDGTITARNTDNGALIAAGSSGTGLALFHIADITKLRIYVQVPENYVPFITPNMSAKLHLPEHPGQIFAAKMTQTASALDPVARTLLIELEVDNQDGALLPGGYAEVHIEVPSSPNTVRLPINTLLFRGQGMEVATIDTDGKVVLKPIQIARDYGNEVEVKAGLAADENIILNPPDSLQNGEAVRIAAPAGKDESGGQHDKKDDDKSDTER
jgi:RND family efflux transporter MFP subunit